MIGHRVNRGRNGTVQTGGALESDLREAIEENERLRFSLEDVDRENTRLKGEVKILRDRLTTYRQQADQRVLQALPKSPDHAAARYRAAQARALELVTTLKNVRLSGDIWFDVRGRCIRQGQHFESLGPTEYLVLVAMCERRGDRLTADQVAAAVRGPEDAPLIDRNTVRTRFTRLRRRLETFGIGYLLPRSRSWGYLLLKELP